jgi:hypothetical protein
MISTMAVTALGGLGALIATVVAAVNSCGGDGVRGGKVLIIGHVGAALAFLVVFFFFLVDSDLIDWLIDGLLRQAISSLFNLYFDCFARGVSLRMCLVFLIYCTRAPIRNPSHIDATTTYPSHMQPKKKKIDV